MSKWTNKDWLLGKTDEQQKKKAEARDELKQLGAEFKGSLKKPPVREGERLANGIVSDTTAISIYPDGTFTTTVGVAGIGKESPRDRLLGFEFETDSMRRKSVTGRGVAAVATGGYSLAAGNNRGVMYVTVTGEKTGVRTFKKTNPQNFLLDDARSLKAAAKAVIPKASGGQDAVDAVPADDVLAKIQHLAELHASGVLTDEEFASKKAQLLDRL